MTLTVKQYHQMLAAGILTDGDPIELLEWWLVPKMSKSPEHSAATRRARAAIERVIPAGWFVDSQEPITTSDSEPEPDVVVLRGDPGRYTHRHPSAEEVTLAIESHGVARIAV